MKDGERLLDLGCCLGLDMRKLAFDGVPSEQIYGLDIEAPFINLDYELFLDKDKSHSSFITEDLFTPGPSTAALDGQIDVVPASHLFHFFFFMERACPTVKTTNPAPETSKGFLTTRKARWEHCACLSLRSYEKRWY